MTHGSLFSGIGGFEISAQRLGWNNIFHSEINPFGQQVLHRHFPESIQYGDITKTDFTKHKGAIDVLSGGFPCQDASIAKQDGEGQQGLKGKRTGLLFEMCRVIREIGPTAIVAENVANFLKVNNGDDFRTVLNELSSMGYNAEWRICRGSDVGAPHHRARMYIVAYPNSFRLQEGQTFFSYVHEKASQIAWSINGTSIQTFRGGSWSCEPPVLCVDDGISDKSFGFSSSQFRKEQLKAYGNAIIPEISYRIFKRIEELLSEYKK